jgi:ATP adenylyltransferase
VDVLWSPWRYDYITRSGSASSSGCVFCDILQNSASDEENYILKRAEFNFVILNIYPYGTGHLLVIPYEHKPLLDDLDKPTSDEMMDITKSAQAALADVYHPEGFNVGMNLGKSAGAGVAGHVHMHILPRWSGDVNFMTSIGETRTMPESLGDTYRKLAGRI